jgi:hemoglobin/transferrin/lactoferrin receptor protein
MELVKPSMSYCYDKRMNFALAALVALALLLGPVWAPDAALAAGQDEEMAAEEMAESAGEDAAEGESMDEEGEMDEEDLSFFGTTSVTATGTLTDTFELATPVEVIDSTAIAERQPNNASDLLRDAPGVDVNGIGPNQTRPIIRGSRGLRVLFLENGLRMNNARRQTDFGEITGLVDVANVEAVEVVRGPSSVLYGTDAIGGVMNLITRVPAYAEGSHIGGTVQLRGSTVDDQTKGRFGVNGHSGALSYQFGYSYRDAADYESGTGSFGDITADDPLNVNDTGLKDESFDGYLGFNLSEKNSFFLRANIYRADQTGFGSVDPEDIGDDAGFRIDILYPFQDFDRYTAGWIGQGMENALMTTADVQLYRQENQRELVNDIFIDIGPVFPGSPNSSVEADSVNFTDLETTGLRGEFTKAIGDRNLLTYGVEYFDDDSFNTDSSVTTTTLFFPFPISPDCEFDFSTFNFRCAFVDSDDVANAPNASNTSIGLFVQDEILLTDRFSAIAGLRWAEVETKAKETPGWDISGLDFKDDQVVGALNLIYGATDRLNLVGSVGTAFRAPNIVERLFNGLTPEGAGYQVLNPDLVSETSLNYDLGFKYQSANIFFEAFYFQNEIDDAIVQYTLSDDEIAALPPDIQDEIDNAGVSFVVQQRNADKLTIDGFEVSGGYRWNSGFSVGGNYTNISGKSESGGGGANSPTGDTYDDKFNLWARFDAIRGTHWWIEGRWRHQGEKDDIVDPGAVIGPIGATIPSFDILALAGGVNLHSSDRVVHSVGLTLENVTDELYAEFSNASFFRPQPGFNAIFNYGLSF